MTGAMNPQDGVRRKRSSERLVATIVLTGTLIVGVVLGIALDRSILWPRLRGRHGPPGILRMLEFSGKPADLHRVRTRMKNELGLSEAQTIRIDTIMAHRSAALQTVRTETEKRVRAMLDTTRTMIDSVLTPAQQVKMREIRARRDRENSPPPPERNR